MKYKHTALDNGTNQEVWEFLRDFLQEKIKVQFDEEDREGTSNFYWLIAEDGYYEEGYGYCVVVYTYYRDDEDGVTFSFDVEDGAEQMGEDFYVGFHVKENEELSEDRRAEVLNKFFKAKGRLLEIIEGQQGAE